MTRSLVEKYPMGNQLVVESLHMIDPYHSGLVPSTLPDDVLGDNDYLLFHPSLQLNGYAASSIANACFVSKSGLKESSITANSSVNLTSLLAMMVPGCGPWGMPWGWRVKELSSTPRRLPKWPRT